MPDHISGSITVPLVTDELYARDAYLVSTEAVVEQVRPEGVILDRTVFLALGGGQPGIAR